MSILTDTANTPEAWSGRASAPSSWEAAGWSRAGQEARFLAARKHLDLREGQRLLDYGCGTGRFCHFLPLGVRYVAYDWAPAMRERCARDQLRAIVLDEEPTGQFDHVVALGTFNLPGSITRTLVQIQKLWALTLRSLVVSLYRGQDERCLQYDPTTISRLAASLTTRFALDGSYLDNDLLLVMHR